MEAAEKVEADPRRRGHGLQIEADPRPRRAKPKADATLKQIASDPETYLDASVVPSDLLIVDTGVVGGPVGKRTGPLDLHLVVKSREGAYQRFDQARDPFEILLTNRTAAASATRSGPATSSAAIIPRSSSSRWPRTRRTPRASWASSSGSSCSSTSTPGPSSTGNPSITRCSRSSSRRRAGPGGAQPSYKDWQKRLA